MANIPVFLPGEFHGQGSLAGYSPWSQKSWTWLANTVSFHKETCKNLNRILWTASKYMDIFFYRCQFKHYEYICVHWNVIYKWNWKIYAILCRLGREISKTIKSVGNNRKHQINCFDIGLNYRENPEKQDWVSWKKIQASWPRQNNLEKRSPHRKGSINKIA